jgi:isoleucyl-tRNA synthetase
MDPLDRWALATHAEVGAKVLQGFEDYEYHTAFHAVYNFFTVELSSFYLDILKDRMYCSGRDSRLRRSGQTAMFRILKDTLRLMAPILPFTTEEAWEVMPSFPGKSESVHLENFPAFDELRLGEAERKEWAALITLRERVNKELEAARERKAIGNSLEAQVTLAVPAAEMALILKYQSDLAALIIVSDVVVTGSDGAEIGIAVGQAPGRKCQRCWNYSTHVGTSADYPEFCARCEAVVRDIPR